MVGEIMKWRLRTASMFLIMTVILLAVGSVIGGVFGRMWLGLIAMLILSLVFSLYAYYFSKRSALRSNKVRLVTEEEEPRLYSIVRSVAERAEIPMPEVGISSIPMPNAFATGRGPKDAAVVVTSGLLHMLPDDELEGVIAHEISHVKNRDILVMSIASTMAAVLSYLSRFALWMMILNAGDSRDRAIQYGIVVALSITVPIAALLVQMGVSRSREYLADETGAKITGNPRALARALARIDSGCESPKNDYDNNSYADMWISNPVRKKKSIFSSLFRTHPLTEDRIARLNAMAEKMEGSRPLSNADDGITDPFFME